MTRWRPALSAIAIASAAPAAAQDVAVPTATELEQVAATVPEQPWYPKGYYDIRVAAAAQVAEYPRPAAKLLQNSLTGPAYNVVDCDAEYVAADDRDRDAARYGGIALEVARLQSEFARLDFPSEVYADPLLAFEKARLERAAAVAAGPADDPQRAMVAAIEENRRRLTPTAALVLARPICSNWYSGGSGPGYGITGGLLGGIFGGAAAPAPPRPVSVVVKTDPSAAEVLLINAFAFKICMRKKPNPWDRFACQWNEIETGVAKPLSGRFVYQVKWPDGTVRKGTREIIPGETSAVTFKKVGS